MAQATFATSHLSGNEIAVLKLLERASPQLAIDQFCTCVDIPMGQGRVVHMQRAINPATDLNQALEGITKASRQLTYEDVNMTIGEYVEIFQSSSVSDELSEFSPYKDAVPVLGDLIAATREDLRWSIFRAANNIVYDTPAHTAIGDVNSSLTLGRIQLAVRNLQNATAQTIRSITKSAAYNDVNVEASYGALCHTNLQPSIRALSGFSNCSDYTGEKYKEEFGKVQNVRLVTTNRLTPFLGAGAAVGASGMISAGGVNVDVYPVVIFGQFAFNSMKIASTKGGYRGPKINQLTGATKDDPGGQRNIISSRWYDAAGIRNQAWVQVILVGAPANPGA